MNEVISATRCVNRVIDILEQLHPVLETRTVSQYQVPRDRHAAATLDVHLTWSTALSMLTVDLQTELEREHFITIRVVEEFGGKRRVNASRLVFVADQERTSERVVEAIEAARRGDQAEFERIMSS